MTKEAKINFARVYARNFQRMFHDYSVEFYNSCFENGLTLANQASEHELAVIANPDKVFY